MSEARGEYRPTFGALYETREYLDLSPCAKLLWHTVKGAMPAWGIGSDELWSARLVARTGYSQRQVRAGLEEMEGSRWIVREESVLWLRNGLRFEPTRNPNDAKHRKALQHYLAGLPRLAIVDAYRDHYPDWMVEADTSGQGRKKGSEKGSTKSPRKGSTKGRGEGRGGEVPSGVATIPTTAEVVAGGDNCHIDQRVGDLVNRMAGHPGRMAIEDVFAMMPAALPPRMWASAMLGYLEGMGTPGGKACTPDELAVACVQWTQLTDEERGPWKPAHFAAFVKSAMLARESAPTARGPKRESNADVAERLMRAPAA